ncbi:MAG: AI-2E family transporter [Alphaproteobacteria bacterium]|nr:AI-2E family transporter [Alphaproteobacteria bacterium]
MPREVSSQFAVRFWLVMAALLCLFIWLLRPILLPFVAGMVIAYFLDPVVDRLSRAGWPRWLSTSLVLLSFVVAALSLVLLLFPLIQSQILTLIASIPDGVGYVRERLMPLVYEWVHKLSPHDVDRLRDAVSAYAGDVIGWAGGVLKGLVLRSVALFDILTLLVITPIVAFYLLRDWPSVTKTIEDLVPRKQYPLFSRAFREINTTLSGFLRGQALVCLSLGLFFSISLTLVGLKYGVIVGILSGAVAFIPYVGTIFCLVVSMTLAFIQFDTWGPILATFLVVLIGQTLESYVLTPRLVGGRVGLHPVWVLFAVFAGGALLGFVGILIAVPVAAVLGVLIRLAVRHYRASPLYRAGSKDKIS